MSAIVPPQLDFQAYTSGSSKEREQFCDELRSALQRWGFVSLTNYGISPQEIQGVFDYSRSFFSLTEAEKLTAPHPPVPNPHRGYSFVGQEFTSGLSRRRELEERQGRRLRDLKETFDWGSTHDSLYPSVWPDESLLPGFRAALEKHFAQARELHQNILRALAECIRAPTNTFLGAHQCNDSEARLAHYPSVHAAGLGGEYGTSRICEHTDSGSVTLLWQDEVGGLEIEDPVTRQFIAVSNPAPAVLVNLGDAMERWSNGLLPAAYHRVGKPSLVTSNNSAGEVPERFSIMYFGKPDRDASLAPLSPFVSASRPARFAPVTGDELNQGTLLRTYEPNNDVASAD
ncbi:hypothetical protein CERZMDRAFT_51823 [Cercospora zeae-maydis SCOH1-5]|uniref:Fe2OG dioxygenase domain-containing protein n=1 Tax=Cercospora zeae-maydis SCOH1-5 TaxID=717836 RepID=A0A6A6F1G0_9PEZI|nr:hypothetical protein CERZMDRAFT_51823 [Cercospora zeae-maydis SCOH1-5]